MFYFDSIHYHLIVFIGRELDRGILEIIPTEMLLELVGKCSAILLLMPIMCVGHGCFFLSLTPSDQLQN
jgi:hypothetical protein